MKRIFLLVLSVLVLSSCTFSLSAEDLLFPPRMSEEQSAIYDALETAIGTSSFKFKYPRRGDFLSACILYDIDWDGVDEAIAFYELKSNDSVSTWISFLVNKNGSWQSIREIPAMSSDIDMVAFSTVTQKDRDNIIVGWSMPGEDYNNCVIYDFDGTDAYETHKIELPYSEMLIENVDDNELKELVLCTKTKTRSNMRLFKFRAGKIVTTGRVSMPSGIKELTQLIFGKFTKNLNTVFADVELGSGAMYTKLVIVDNSSLVELYPEDIGIYESFQRVNSSAVCRDVNYDGFIDVPVSIPLPGYEDEKPEDKIYRTEYMTVKDGTLETVLNLLVNETDGYQLTIPDSWLDMVTVKQQSDTGEWRFYIYSDQKVQTEILRIKAVKPMDYQDKLETENYKLLAENGTYKYICYIPEGDYPGYTLNFEEVKQNFEVISTSFKKQ